VTTESGGSPSREPEEKAPKVSTGRKILAVVIASALTLVIIAPITLSSSDLVAWAASPSGLDLDNPWPWLVFIALDAAAATCVGMVVFSAWKGESGGLFHVLTWMFAGGSAVANYRHGITTNAKDDQYFFPVMSLMGPLLLEVVLSRVRRWVREDNKTQISARPKFGSRWLPGVAFYETLRAWATAHREGIAEPLAAIALVRERDALAKLPPADQVRYAWQALGHSDPYQARLWLTARGVQVDQAALDQAATAVAALPAAPSVSVEVLPERQRPAIESAPTLPEPPEPIEPEPTKPPADVVDVRRPEVPELPPAAPVRPEVPEVLEPARAESTAERINATDTGEIALIEMTGEISDAEVLALPKRKAYALALSKHGDDAAAAAKWLRDLGMEKVDQSEIYKVRRAAAAGAVQSRRSTVRALPGGGSK
jgi:hypothetical protein